MWLQADLQIQIARRRAAVAGTALAGKPNLLAVADARRNSDLQRARPDGDASVFVELRRLEFDGVSAAAERVFQIDLNLCGAIFAGSGVACAPEAAAALLAEWTACAKQRREEVAEAGVLPSAERRRVLEVPSPVRRRRELLTLPPLRAELIVGGALLRILEHLVGFLHFLELVFGVGLLAHVRMKFARKFAIDA